jgi:photosystem II stability/assembly factor-like uncharacterized protein
MFTALVALVLLAGQTDPDRPTPVVPPPPTEAKAELKAWFETRHFDLWANRNGVAGKWQELGPTTILNGWGGMENAGRMTALAVDPTDSRIVYAGAASGGIWKSEDFCATWHPVADFQPSLSYGCLAIDPFDHNTIYAGMGEPNNSQDSFHGAGLMRSRDAGKTWQLVATNVFIGQNFSRIVPNPARPGWLYVATSRGVLRTTDYGGTWVNLLDGDATDLLVDPQSPETIIAALGRAFGDSRNGLYRSDDAGQTWHRLTNDLPFPGRELGRLQFSQCAKYPQVIYAAMWSHGGQLLGLMKTTDFGHSWIRLPNAPNYAGSTQWYYNVVAVSPVNPNAVFVAGFSTFRSLDGGETWEDNTRSYAGGAIHPDHHALTFDPNDPETLYLCADGGVFRTRDLGNHWESVCHGLGTVQFTFVDVHPTDPKVAWGGTQDNGTNKFRGVPEWTNTFSGDGGVTRVSTKNPNVVYTEYVDLAMLKSTDGGESWSWGVTEGIDLSEGALFYAPFNLDPNDPDTLVAGARRVYRTTNAAGSWTPISPILGSRVSALTIAPRLSAVIYAGTSDGRMWVTPDTGKSWYEITAGMERGYIADICVDPNNARHIYVAQSTWDHSTLWRSEDAGGHWTNISDNLPPVPVHGLVLNPSHPGTIYAGTEVGVFISTQRGGRWRRFGSGLPNAPVYSIVANKQTGFVTVGTHGRGAWRIPLGEQ